jgi:flagellar basal-body rod protein FlgC
MSMFPSIDIAGTGLDVDQTWIDTIGGNVANADDAITPGSGATLYQEQSVVAEAAPGATGGVQVEQIQTSNGPGVLSSDPSSPVADAQGLVEYPNVDIASQLTSLVQAQTDYEANANVMSNSDDAYKAILAIKA